jgi:RNA polymerase sigma-70 factor (ECF subfamily)
VWFLARKFTKTREDAEDVTQEIFIDIWKSAARFDPTKSPEQAFVMLISRRRLIDCLRKAKRYPLTLSFDGTEKKQSSEDYKRLHMYVEMKLAVDALNKLNIHEKRIIKMSVYGGISNREIAQTVRLPIGTVKSQIWRDLQKIRKSIDLPTYSPL